MIGKHENPVSRGCWTTYGHNSNFERAQFGQLPGESRLAEDGKIRERDREREFQTLCIAYTSNVTKQLILLGVNMNKLSVKRKEKRTESHSS